MPSAPSTSAGPATRLESLIEAGRALARLRSLPELLDYFIDLVARELDVERASLMLVDESNQELRIEASRGLGEIDPLAIRVPLGQGVAGRVAATGEPFLVGDAAAEHLAASRPDLGSSFMSAPIVLSLPIKYSERVLGVINATNRRSGVPFGDAELAYLSGLAGLLAVAVENARHVEELRRTYATLKKTQRELLRAERRRVAGRMAADMAHDFNNLLSSILTQVQLAICQTEKSPPDSDAIRGKLLAAERKAMDASSKIKRIRDYTRHADETADGAVDLAAALRVALVISRSSWSRRQVLDPALIEITTDLAPVEPIRGNRGEIEQVFADLILNAVEAMPGGGKLSLRCYDDGDTVAVEIRDTGAEAEPRLRMRVFEPWFTSREGGRGLAVSLANAILGRHGAELNVQGWQGRGALFEIRFPTAAIEVDTTPAVAIASPKQRGSVLLIEDDELIRDTYEEALAEGGFRVVAASSGDQALTRFEAGRFDLVITDLTMPGKSGLEVAELLRQRDPRLPIVLISGWTQIDSAELARAGVATVLHKPCLIETLLEAAERHSRR